MTSQEGSATLIATNFTTLLEDTYQNVVGPVAPEELVRERFGEEEDPELIEVEDMEFYCVLFIVMLFFFVMAACNEKYKPRCGH